MKFHLNKLIFLIFILILSAPLKGEFLKNFAQQNQSSPTSIVAIGDTAKQNLQSINSMRQMSIKSSDYLTGAKLSNQLLRQASFAPTPQKQSLNYDHLDIPRDSTTVIAQSSPYQQQMRGYTTQSSGTFMSNGPQGIDVLHANLNQYPTSPLLRSPMSLRNCPCASQIQVCPVCGVDGESESISCPCDPNRPQCPPCILAKTVKQMHVYAAENAKTDALTQEQLAKKSDLEKQLFAQAKKFASEAEEEESTAYKLSLELQQHSSKAQIARNKMIRAENQAKQLALETIHTMTIHPSHQTLGVPGLSIRQSGIKRTAVVQNEPQYQLSIQSTDGSGFMDQTDFDFQSQLEGSNSKSLSLSNKI